MQLSRMLLMTLMMALAAAPVQMLAQASQTASLINQQLDKQVKLELDGSLPSVLVQIAKQTGVPIEAQPQVWELLPWGRETMVKAKVENQTLREALRAIATNLGLTFTLREEAVELAPMPALRRLGRKSQRSELEALALLAATPLGQLNAPAEPGVNPPRIAADKPRLSDLVEAIDARLGATKPDFAIFNRSATSPDVVNQDTPIVLPRNATLLDALEAIQLQTSATWYPWDKSIVILPKKDQTRRLLEKEVILRHEGADVAQVLTDLSSRCGVSFRYEPGAIQSLPPQNRHIRLILSAAAIDALEAISGATGLGYVVKDDGVYIWNTANQAAAAPRDRAIGWFTLPDSGMNVMITESQCPPDVREYIELQKKKHFEAVRKMMLEEGFKPSTRPAPANAEKPGETPAEKPEKAAPPAKAPEAPGKDL